MSDDVLFWISDDDAPEYYKLHQFGDEVHRVDLRKCAYRWHGGQWSPLYAFASSGAIVRGLAAECESAAQHADDDETSDEYELAADRDFDDSLYLMTIANIARAHGDE